MKKKIVILLAFLMCCVLLVSCGEVNDGEMSINDNNQDSSISIKDEVYVFLTDTRYVFDGYTPLTAVVIESYDELSEIYDVKEMFESLPPPIFDASGKECSEGIYGEEYFENGYIIAVITHMGRCDDVYIAEGEKVGGSISVRFEQCIEGLTDAWGRVISLVPMEGKYDGETIVVSRIDLDPGDPNNPHTWAEYESKSE